MSRSRHLCVQCVYMCLCCCKHTDACAYSTVRARLFPSGKIFCRPVLVDLMQVESWWPCVVSLVPNAKRAAGFAQISATFTLLAANFLGLLCVSYPRHHSIRCRALIHPLPNAKAFTLTLLILHESRTICYQQTNGPYTHISSAIYS